MSGTTFKERLNRKVDLSNLNLKGLARRAGVSYDIVRELTRDRTKSMSVDNAKLLIDALGIKFSDVFDEAETPSRIPISDNSILIPRYKAVVSAGPGAVNEANPPVVDHIPFTKDFLNRKLGKASAEGLFIVTTSGDSMEPTIGNDDLVLVDSHYNGKEAGLYAVNYGDETLVKRIQRIAGGYSLISDNTAYPPITVQGQETEQLQIIGKVLWISRVVVQG